MSPRADTIAAIATPPGHGAVAIVRVSGARTRSIALRIFHAKRALRPRLATFGAVFDAQGNTIDRGLALFMPAPHSYTGEDVLELHVHGSPIIASETLRATLAAGARLAQPGEFTRRAFLNGKLDLSQAEAVADVIAAESLSAARGAEARLAGGLQSEVERLRAALSQVVEELTGALDFPDEVPDPDAADLRRRFAAVLAALRSLHGTWESGRIVREGVGVAIVGPPNAGKSSLLNALLGEERALVSMLPGTTRDTIEETIAIDGVHVRLVDTAGIRSAGEELEAAGIARTERALAHATLALVVVDGSAPLGAEAGELLARTRARPRLVFFNKADLGTAGFRARAAGEADAISGSVRRPHDLVRLREAIAAIGWGRAVPDLARPHLASARQADAVLQAICALAAAELTLDQGQPVDLVAPDVMAALGALGQITGAAVTEALLDGIFARFCIGK